MAKKMYYTEEESAAKLGTEIGQLAELVKQKKLQAYRDGAKRMFKAEQVDALAGQPKEDEIELSPMDTTTDVISLAETDQTKAPSKEDTVITAEGISIFDDEDLEIEAADPMAKTRIAPSMEDQIAIEGVGSGSGLLDLTRESDDTSLGAEVLDNIDMEGSVGAGIIAEAEAPAYAPQSQAAVIEQSVGDQIDASSGLFGGIIVGCAIAAMLLGVVVLGAVRRTAPNMVETMQSSMGIVVVGVLVVIGACAVIGMTLGKSIAAQRSAMR